MKRPGHSLCRYRTVIFILLFCIGNITYGALPKVLLLAADEDTYIVDVQSKLTATGLFSTVDIFNIRFGTPGVDTLLRYNAVLLWTNYVAVDAELLGDNLAVYIENGGGVVDAVSEIAQIPISGDYDSSVYRCIVPLDRYYGVIRTLDSVLLPEHPVMKNILTYTGGTTSISSSDSITEGSYIIALYDNDAIFAAAKEGVGKSKARRVSLNFFPPSSDIYASGWDPATDGALIMANALVWVSTVHNTLPAVMIGGSNSDAGWVIDVKEKLLATGMFSTVDTINLRLNTPSLSTLQQYNAVLFWGDQDYADSALLGNNLASFIDLGGLVVDAQFALSTYYEIGGRFRSEEYQCLLPDEEESDVLRALGTIEKPGHAIMNGVSSFNGGSSSYHTTSQDLAPEAYVIARYDDNDILIAARDSVGPTGIRRVSLNFFPPSSDLRADFWDASTDGAKIMANALIWGLGSDADNCLNFDAVDDYIDTQIDPDESSPFSWISSILIADDDEEKMIFGTCTNTGEWDGMWFEVDLDYLRFYTNFGEFYSIDRVPLNEWCNIALTSDSVTFKIYMNGLLQNEYDIDMSEVEGGNLHIGSIGSGETSMYMFNGNMDNISIWDRALTQDEIIKFQNRKFCGTEQGLVAYYDFNQGIAGGDNPNDTILLDRLTGPYSSLGDTRHGVLHNFALTGGTSNWIGSIAYTSNNIPLTQASDVTFGGPSAGTVNISWTRGNGGKCAVFMKHASSGTALPEFEATYNADPNFGDGSQIGTSGWYCIYNGTGTNTTAADLTGGETYIVHVCEYNGDPGNEDYNTNAGIENPATITMNTVPEAITQTQESYEIRIYPNPAHDYLLVHCPGNMDLPYQIYDITGNKIQAGKITDTTIDISGLKPGMYILDINHSNKFKIVKQ